MGAFSLYGSLQHINRSLQLYIIDINLDDTNDVDKNKPVINCNSVNYCLC